MSNNLRETKQRFTLRKNKRYKNLVSVGLGLFIATATGVGMGEASANEVEKAEANPIPATNNTETQAPATKEATNSQKQAEVSGGGVEVTLPHTQVDKAVAEAEAAGVNVVKEEDVSFGTVSGDEVTKKAEEVAADYNKQVEEIKETVTTYEDKKEEVAQENATRTETYNKELAAVNAHNEKVSAENKKNEEKLKAILASPGNKVIENDKYFVHGQENPNAAGTPGYYDMKLVTKDNSLSVATVADYVGWHDDTTLEAGSGNAIVTTRDLNTVKNAPIIAMMQPKAGDHVWFRNVATLTDGRKLDLKASLLEVISPNTEESRLWFYQFESNNIGLDMIQVGLTKTRWEFFDKEGNNVNLPISLLFTDVDYTQTYKIEMNHLEKYYPKLTPGVSDVSQSNARKAHADWNGFFKDNAPDNTWMTDYDDLNAVPAGSAMFYGIDNKIDISYVLNGEFSKEELKDSNKLSSWAGGYTLFGNTTKYENIRNTPLPPKPLPKLELLPEPTAPEVRYHYNTLQVQPKVEKHATNVDNVVVSNKEVPKMSEVKWVLETEEIPAGRDVTDVFEITDSLPQGFELDLTKTIEAAKENFTVEYDKATHTLKYTAAKKLFDLLNKDLNAKVTAPAPEVYGTVINDAATYANNFQLNINNKYKAYSNTVKVSTPGDPNDPNNPNDNEIRPVKENTNKNGVTINGKEVLPNSINYYKLTWDFDQYKGLVASKDLIAKGFHFVDDYPEEALEVLNDKVTLVDSTGKAVEGVSVKQFDSLDKAPAEIKEMLTNAKITPKGAFQVFVADKPEEFFNKYVATGNSIRITDPMKVKEAFNGKYENKAYQIDFGNGYETEVVSNNVPKLTSEKDVVVTVGSEKSLNNTKIALGTTVEYELTGALLGTNRADELERYSFFDNYDEKADEYAGDYKVLSTVEIKLKDGTTIQKGTDLTKHTTQVIDFKEGKVTVEFDKEFLSNVSTDSQFQAQLFLQVKRIASGTVKNEFTNTINDYETISNTVETKTPYTTWKTEDGVPLKDQKDGEFPDGEGDDIPGYTHIKTTVDKDGNVVNIYKKLTPPTPGIPTPPTPEPQPVVEKVLPKTSAIPSEHSNAPAAALATITLGTLYLVSRRRVEE